MDKSERKLFVLSAVCILIIVGLTYICNANKEENKHIEKLQTEKTIEVENKNEVVLIPPHYCNMKRTSLLNAEYCNIGALNTYYTNKEVTKGKYYFEAQIHLSPDAIPIFNNIGVISNLSEFTSFCSLDSPEQDGKCSSAEALEHSVAKNLNNHDIVGIAIDFNNGFIFYSINGVWKETPKKFITKGRAYTPAFEVGKGSVWTTNFGTKKFRYSIPEGYKPYN